MCCLYREEDTYLVIIIIKEFIFKDYKSVNADVN